MQNTHSNYVVDIGQIFKVSREGESEPFRKFFNLKNRMLLWHGSRLTNWTGILSQEAPVTGYMFGKGVYFADMSSKSANYCNASHGSTKGVLISCEVALGDMAELLSENYHADCLPPGKLSTKGVGATAPDMSESQVLGDGVVVPLGNQRSKEALSPACYTMSISCTMWTKFKCGTLYRSFSSKRKAENNQQVEKQDKNQLQKQAAKVGALLRTNQPTCTVLTEAHQLLEES